MLLATALIIGGCQGQKSDLLENDKFRSEFYSAILRNHKYTKELLDSIVKNEHSRMMMDSDSTLVNHLIAGMPAHHMIGQMVGRIERDSMTCKDACMKMMEKGPIKNTMMKMMTEKGMISEECMHEKGMMHGQKSPHHAR